MRLQPLTVRLTPTQQHRRDARILARQIAYVFDYATQQSSPLRRGFLGRVKWLLLGA